MLDGMFALRNVTYMMHSFYDQRIKCESLIAKVNHNSSEKERNHFLHTFFVSKYRSFHYKDNTISQPSYRYNGNPGTVYILKQKQGSGQDNNTNKSQELQTHYLRSVVFLWWVPSGCASIAYGDGRAWPRKI